MQMKRFSNFFLSGQCCTLFGYIFVREIFATSPSFGSIDKNLSRETFKFFIRENLTNKNFINQRFAKICPLKVFSFIFLLIHIFQILF